MSCTAACLALMGAGCDPGEPTSAAQGGTVEREVERLWEQRQRLDRTVWAPEARARQYERAVVRLWDTMKDSADPLAVLADADFERLTIGPATGRSDHEHGITITSYGPPDEGEYRTFTPAQWRRTLSELDAAGYRLVMSDWRHEAFEPDAQPPVSTFSVRLYATHPERAQRLVISAELRVRWSAERGPDALPRADSVAVTGARVMRRTGEPFFERLGRLDPSRERQRPTKVQPVLVYDLNGDGLAEVVLGGANRVYWNRGANGVEPAPLLAYPVDIRQSAVVADFTGDGAADLMCESIEGRILLYEGDDGGRFPDPPRTVLAGTHNVMVFTAGDIDGDGDLDVWAAQYKPAYLHGQMPTPYYDANDGFPSYLLRNEGGGRFTDVTEEAGLAANRFRRTYSSSLVDLDDDGHLDLMVVSDFAGVELYANDGAGRFSEITDRALAEWHNFGMAHAIDDFNLDGRLDFVVIGMSSATARRLDRMGLGRAEFPDHQRMRPIMAYGNRMYLGRADGAFEMPPFNDEVARTGWSWGASSFDFDNDGDRDLYIANGHISGASTDDYCSVFWRHDVYAAGSGPDPVLDRLFTRSQRRLLEAGGVGAEGQSWDGYQKNALLMNEGGRSFVDVGFLMGVGFEFDARSVLSADLDADGRMDLLVSEDPPAAAVGPAIGQALHVIRNRAPDAGNWIGVRLREHGGGLSPVGAKVTVRTTSGPRVGWMVTGDSFRAQHAATSHFGLGEMQEVQAVEVRWPNGRVSRLDRPAVNRYHDVEPGDSAGG